MSILTEEEIDALSNSSDACDDPSVLIKATEAKLLAKLAGMALPEPELMPLLLIGVKHSGENLGERSFTEAGFYSAASEIFKLGQNQAFAQGAASQLSAIRTLEHLGYTNCGGEYWKPPLGKK